MAFTLFSGIIIGIAIAALYFLSIKWVSAKIQGPDKVHMTFAPLAGMVIRLTVVGLIFFGVSLHLPAIFSTVLLSFVVAFSILKFIEVLLVVRQLPSNTQ